MINVIFEQLAATSSRNEKISILKQNAADYTLQRTIFLALDPFTKFHIIKIPDYIPATIASSSLEEALENLQVISGRRLTGRNAISYLKDILESVAPDDAQVIERIVQKDLRCGVSESTVNSVWKGLIRTFDVCLAHKDISGIKYPAYAQVKMDGGRCHLYFDGQVATAYSRNGKPIEMHGVFNQAAQRMMKAGEIWDGEIVFFANSKAMDRKTSNGLFNKGVKGTISVEEAQKAIFTCWDIVDVKSVKPYSERFNEMMLSFVAGYNIKPVYTVIVDDQQQAEEFFVRCVAAGEEGAIIKNMDFKWEPKRVKGVGKMKAEEEADLIVVGWEPGTGKHEGRVGALVAETADGLLRVKVGTGFSDEQRELDNCYVGKIITVKYNQIITDKKKTTASLFLPRFVEVRNDKNVANNLCDLK